MDERAELKKILPVGGVQVILELVPALIAGQPPEIRMDVRGTEDPFLVRHILRTGEDLVIGKLQEGLNAMMSGPQNRKSVIRTH